MPWRGSWTRRHSLTACRRQSCCLDDAHHVRVVGNLVEGEASIGARVSAMWHEHDVGDGTTIRLPQRRRS